MQHFWNQAPVASLIDILRVKLFGAQNPRAPPRTIEAPPAGSGAGMQPPLPADTPQLEVVQGRATAEEYTVFLSTNYLTAGPDGPRSSLTADTLETLRTGGARPLLYRSGGRRELLGCILSAPLGKLYRAATPGHTGESTFSLRLIRDFCVGAAHRRQGVGTKLLLGVLRDCAMNCGGVQAVFLKEGAPLGFSASTPLRSSFWIYRRIAAAADQRQVRELPLKDALELVAIYGLGNERLLYNRPPEGAAVATRIFLYEGFRGSAVAAFTPAYQMHPRDGAAIIFQTGWVETGTLLPMERATALRQLSDAAAVAMHAPWVWMDGACAGGTVQPPWRADGPFHWYMYGWTADLYGNAELFLVV
jgi:hypothetical protein